MATLFGEKARHCGVSRIVYPVALFLRGISTICLIICGHGPRSVRFFETRAFRQFVRAPPSSRLWVCEF